MTSHLPWFTTWGIEFSRPIENVFSIVSEVNGNRKNNRWLMVNYDVLASEVHLWNAWYSLRCNERTEKMVAKTPDTEFIRLLSGTHQINKAFEKQRSDQTHVSNLTFRVKNSTKEYKKLWKIFRSSN